MAVPVSGRVTVTTAGTAVQCPKLAKRCVKVLFQANAADNTGVIYIGDSNVSSASGWVLQDATDETGWLKIEPLEGDTLELSDFWVDAAQDGDDVNYLALME